MYSDCQSYKILGSAIINWDANILIQNKILDSRLFYLGLGIIESEEFYFRKVLLGEREDKAITTLGRAILTSNTKLLESDLKNYRVIAFGKSIIDNSIEELESIKYDHNLYNLAKAIIIGNEHHLDLLNNTEVENFFMNVKKTDFSGIKNVMWDHSFVLQCLVCNDEILPNDTGFLSYYFASNENKSVNHTFIYFKEVKRHLFYKFCSRECCTKWVG
jgi:hypothetical protein